MLEQTEELYEQYGVQDILFQASTIFNQNKP